MNATASEIEPHDALPAGSAVNGFHIEAVLGRGGFGITYRVRDLLDQRFALKECFPQQFARRHGSNVVAKHADEAGSLADCRRRFLEEAQALVRLGAMQGSAGHIVRILTIFEANDTAYSLMEFLPGQSLDARLNDMPGGLPPAELARVLRGLLLGLRLVHSGGLAHRDVKPANVLLAKDGRPVLIDFGSARAVHRENDSSFTQIYSAGYAPIEQILGTAQGPFSDIYAVGSVGYRAIGGKLTGALPRYNAAQAGQPDPLRPASEIGAGRYPASLLAMLDAALILEAEARPASADAMLRMLDGAPSDATIVGSPAPARKRDGATVISATPLTPAGKPSPDRNPPWIWIAGSVGAAALAGLVWVLLPGRVPPSPGTLPQNVAALPSTLPPPPRPNALAEQLRDTVPEPPPRPAIAETSPQRMPPLQPPVVVPPLSSAAPESRLAETPQPAIPPPSDSAAPQPRIAEAPPQPAPVLPPNPAGERPARSSPMLAPPAAGPPPIPGPLTEAPAPRIPALQPAIVETPPATEAAPTPLALVQPSTPALQPPQRRVVLRAREVVEIAFRDPATGRIMSRQTLTPGATQAVPPEHEGWSLLVTEPERLEILVDGQPIPEARPGYRPLLDFPLTPAGLLRGAPFAPAPPSPPVPPPPVSAVVAPPPTPVAPAPPARRVVQPPAPTPGSAARCRSILSRAQIGEPLSDGDRAFLRTDCRG